MWYCSSSLCQQSPLCLYPRCTGICYPSPSTPESSEREQRCPQSAASCRISAWQSSLHWRYESITEKVGLRTVSITALPPVPLLEFFQVRKSVTHHDDIIGCLCSVVRSVQLIQGLYRKMQLQHQLLTEQVKRPVAIYLHVQHIFQHTPLSINARPLNSLQWIAVESKIFGFYQSQRVERRFKPSRELTPQEMREKRKQQQQHVVHLSLSSCMLMR